MKKSTQILLGIFSLSPVACIVCFLLALVIFSNDKTVDNAFLSLISVVLFVYVLPITLVPFFIVAVYYVFHAMQHARLSAFERVAWISILIFTVGIASPIYWLVQIWNSHRVYGKRLRKD